ncbi:hypothetical protein G6F57_001598 [Rhizopus arrhizus]|jgi:hypothetical protein|uniref:Uncharacterized protein n=1 Tax=Rhizopus oryzae TaxID=64495 RepID=A0A9P6XKF3_RHIOR|nr:hypothetical protein G6F23_000775 [Rhizopus arrhizus]KAG1425911.1 hypothetical protein G6F58_001709 [Rhizopus delemar]KAG0764960.1 hypothetical protein G6F24_004803 [Rhizopus arrhizus]KAG0786864.1 hypothetical protein G6F22_007502 [Rhizopus arrhizus]KAG0791612.1 hypothetical protein G6F21_004955 [Rhizopus arrhizus]
METEDILKEERHETTRIEKIEHDYAQIQRKFHKRNEPGGYDTIQEYWEDFTHVVQLTLHLKTSSSIQILLNLTGDFHDVFDEFNETKKSLDCREYFEAMEFAWKSIIQTHKVDQTDKVRILNVLRDGQDRAAVLSLPSAYSHAIQMLSGE